MVFINSSGLGYSGYDVQDGGVVARGNGEINAARPTRTRLLRARSLPWRGQYDRKAHEKLSVWGFKRVGGSTAADRRA